MKRTLALLAVGAFVFVTAGPVFATGATPATPATPPAKTDMEKKAEKDEEKSSDEAPATA